APALLRASRVPSARSVRRKAWGSPVVAASRPSGRDRRTGTRLQVAPEAVRAGDVRAERGLKLFQLRLKLAMLTPHSPSPRRGNGWGEGVPPVATVAPPHPALRADLSPWESKGGQLPLFSPHSEKFLTKRAVSRS